jgi:GNAT superfamily N-acetyltransferase
MGLVGVDPISGQRTRQYPAAREPAYRPPPRLLSRSSSRNITATLPGGRAEGGAGCAVVTGAPEYSLASPESAGLAGRMHIERLDLRDADTLRGCFEVMLAAQQADEPDGPWFTERPFYGWLTVGWGGDPREVWLVRDPASGSVAGWYKLDLPDLENLDQAELALVVHPAQRRHGLGHALLEHAVARAAANGRSALSSPTRGVGDSFARSTGAERGLVDIQRVMDLRAMSDEQLARLRESAGQAAAGYSLVSWTGPVPEEFIEQAAVLFAALNDAPHDSHVAPAVWDARRVRERVNALRPHYGLRIYAIAAVQDDTGEPAGLTEVAVDPADPGWGHQMLTGVTRPHRGHRLGLLVKTAMAQWLREAEPALERIDTWNAESNRYMIAVNEALGYTVVGRPSSWWKLDVAPAPGKRAWAERTGVAG